MHDVAIVGGGPAGLAIAYCLRDLGLDIRVFEASGEVGGRTKSVLLAGDAANTGAMFIYRNTRTHELATELGIHTVPFTPTTYGIHIHGRTVVAESSEELAAQLPLSETSRAALLDFMRNVIEEYTAFTSGGDLSQGSESLAGVTVAEHFRNLDPELRPILEAAVRGGAVGDISQLSAKYALRYFASYIAREKNNRLYPIHGMQEIPRALARHLPPGTVQTSTEISDVRVDTSGDFYELLVHQNGNVQTVQARHVVMAVPAPLVNKICRSLPAWKTEALQKAHTPGSTTLNVAADISGLPHFRSWSFITIVGRKFEAIINPAPQDVSFRSDKNIAHFVCYGNKAGYQPGFGEDPKALNDWVDDFLAVAPELRGRIREVHGQTWEHCFAVLTTERPHLLPHLQRPVGNLHFAGDYSSASAGTHGAYDEAWRVAGLLRQSFEKSCRPPAVSSLTETVPR